MEAVGSIATSPRGLAKNRGNVANPHDLETRGTVSHTGAGIHTCPGHAGERQKGTRPWIMTPQSDAHPDPIPQSQSQSHSHGAVIAVVGTRGGCGATSLAVGLAVAAVDAGSRAVLIDADRQAAPLNQALGLARDRRPAWADFAELREVLPPDELPRQLATGGGTSALTGPWGQTRDRAAARGHMLSSCALSFDVTVVDLPRYELHHMELPAQTQVLPLFTLQSDSILAGTALMQGRPRARYEGQVITVPMAVVLDHGPVPWHSARRVIRNALDTELIHRLKPERSINGAADFGDLQRVVRRGAIGRMCRMLLSTAIPKSAADLQVG